MKPTSASSDLNDNKRIDKPIIGSEEFFKRKKIQSLSNGRSFVKQRNMSESSSSSLYNQYSNDNLDNFIKKEESSTALSSSKRKTNISEIKGSPTSKKEFTINKFVIYLKSLRQLFKFSFILVISILVNSLYFNFYYLPSLTNNNNNLNANVNNLKQEKLSYDERSSNNDRFFKFKYYDHVAFPTVIANSDRDKAEKDLATSFLQTLGLPGQDDKDEADKRKKMRQNEDKKKESQMALHLAKVMLKEGKQEKAAKIYKYALSLDPNNYDTLNNYGEYLEMHKKDIIKAEHLYNRVIRMEPKHDKASVNLKRALPLVNKLDRKMLDELDILLKQFYDIPSTSSALKRAKKEAYFMHIYHSNAIEGNTLNLQQTRHIVEDRMAINGKSLYEHQEVLGLDSAMRFMNETLLYRRIGDLTLDDILEIHRRLLGYCDPIESGKLRQHQVYVGKFIPPAAQYVKQLMDEFIEWINSNQLLTEAHPVQIAALVHYKFVYIHPFYDGNGRTGRLLMNLILMKFGYPPVIIKKHQRLEYYEYLEMANQGDARPFIRFISKCTKLTLEDYIRVCNNSHNIGGESQMKMIQSNAGDDEEVVSSFYDYSTFLDDSGGIDFKSNENSNDDDKIILKPNYQSVIVNDNIENES